MLQKMTMVKRWMKILRGRTEVAVNQGLGRCYKIGELSGYWNDLTGKVSNNTLLDENGIPLSVIVGGKKVNFPIAVLQYALGRYDLGILESREVDKHLMELKKCADWALAAQRPNGSWDTFGPIGSAKYTVSSMAQGEGCSMLLRAYRAFSDERYFQAALSAIRFMLTDINDGGTAVYDGDDLFLEEYPQNPRRSVLNGWIFSLFGLYDASLFESSYKKIFIRSSETLAKHLDNYDSGYWSLYDLERRIASPAYHRLHIAQLHVLFEMTGDIRFIERSKKFEQYTKKRINEFRAVSGKIVQKLKENSDAVIVQ